MKNESSFSAATFPRLLAPAALAAVLCSCAVTSVKKTWKSPDCKQPVEKIAVLTIEERGLLRQGFENRLVTQLDKAGSPAVATFDQLSLPEIKEDKRAAAARFRGLGADSVLILRTVSVSSSYHETQPTGERYTSTITGFESTGWYDYFSMGFMDMSSTYGNLKYTVYLEASLYSLSTEKRLWSALTKTVLKDNTDRVAEMDPLVGKIVGAMVQDGVIR